MDDLQESYDSVRRLQFRMRLSTISAIGEANDSEHPNVLRLSIIRRRLDHIIIALILRLPMFLQSLPRALFPGFFLPDRVILKRLKPDWLDEFDNEKRIYERLKNLQGRMIPRLYGEARFEGTRALVLAEVLGIMPWEQELPPPKLEEFKALVEVVFRELNVLGLGYEDISMGNFIIAEDRVVLVDLESVYEAEPEDREYMFNSDRVQLGTVYQRYLDNYENGLL
ncbi:hypothetical protein CEP51_015396 [Fusarium floridanum]|uniref:Non-specific serine/threonine protein kinase n=1 Tax=Fusarium floridanum TaxID=1325733 RepID=A0A428PAE8_9HYPO|nr:hypothetical protein CEP51_015396 [Fusarium floridanum]